MKHGYLVLGRCEIFGEISYGSFRTLSEAQTKYLSVQKSINITEYERGHLRLVELVERKIAPLRNCNSSNLT